MESLPAGINQDSHIIKGIDSVEGDFYGQRR